MLKTTFFQPDKFVAEKLKASDMITRPLLRLRSVIMGVNWAMAAIVYYGIGMSMTVLGGNIFLNFILSGVAEILGYIICIIFTNHWGRKPIIVTK